MKSVFVTFLGFSFLSITASADELCGTVYQQSLSSGSSYYFIANEHGQKQVLHVDDLLVNQVGNEVCAVGEPIGMYAFKAISIEPYTK
ncbi:MAG: hypothetical protein ACXVCP_06885 [Bdellovibrio sp.]